MTRKVARDIARQECHALLALDISEILSLLGNNRCDFINHDGITYRIRRRVHRIRRKNAKLLRVSVAVDDRGILSSRTPATQRRTLDEIAFRLAEDRMHHLFSKRRGLILKLLGDPCYTDYRPILANDIIYTQSTHAYYENKWTQENVRVCVHVSSRQDWDWGRRVGPPAVVFRSIPTQELTVPGTMGLTWTDTLDMRSRSMRDIPMWTRVV